MQRNPMADPSQDQQWAEPIIQLTSVNKYYGSLHVLRDVSVDIAAGEVVVVIGPSGSGNLNPLPHVQPTRNNRFWQHQVRWR